MLRRNALAIAEDCIAAGSFQTALRYLCTAKTSVANQQTQALAPSTSVDYLRALCFLRLKEPLSARQALQEELRHTPANEDARDLLNRVNSSIRGAFALPSAIADSEPLFAAFYKELQAQHAQSQAQYFDAQFTTAADSLAWPRLFSLYCHARELCEERIAGDFVECGVTNSSSAALLAMVAKEFGSGRKVIQCDVMAMPSEETSPTIVHPSLGSPLQADVITATGPYEVTLPQLIRDGVVRDVALLNLDCDWYPNAKTAIGTLYPRVRKGGVVQIDDYNYWDGCKLAVREHLDRHHMPISCLQAIDANAVWFRKE